MARTVRKCANCGKRRACSLPMLPPFEYYCDHCRMLATLIDSQRLIAGMYGLLKGIEAFDKHTQERFKPRDHNHERG